MLTCPQCQSNNEVAVTACVYCGESLRLLRAERQLDLTAAAISEGRYEQAQAALLAADREMLGLPTNQSEQRLVKGRAYFLQGQINYRRGSMVAARADLLLARSTLEGMADDRAQALLARGLNILGIISYLERRFEEASQFYLAAAEVNSTGAADIRGSALNNTGAIYEELGQPERAIGFYQQSLAEAQRSQNPINLLIGHSALAMFYGKHGPYQLALSHLEQSAAASQKVEHPIYLAQIRAEIGNVYVAGGRLSEAEYYLRLAYNQVQGQNNSVLSEIVLARLLNLAAEQEPVSIWLAAALKELLVVVNEPVQDNELYLPLARYWLTRYDPRRIRHHLLRVRERMVKEQGGESGVNNQRAAGLLAAGLGEWQTASKLMQQVISSGPISRYDRATALTEYAFILQTRARREDDPDLQAAAATKLAEAAAIFEQIGLPQRQAQVQVWLHRVYPSSLNFNNQVA